MSDIARWSVAVALVVLALKTIAWWLTGSAGLFSDALESTVNVATALAAWWTVRFAARPADDDHPFGHHKAEYLSAVVVGVLIVVSALLILREAWLAFEHARAPGRALEGIALAALASLLNGLWSRKLAAIGRREQSPALQADARHLMVDIYTTAGVMLSLAITALTGWFAVDALCALAVGVHVLREGYRVIAESVGGLMDRAVEPEVEQALHECIRGSAGGALEVHDIRTRRAGPTLFVDCHLVVDSEMSVGDAHDICDEIESAIDERWPDARTSIHVEPRHKLKGEGIAVP